MKHGGASAATPVGVPAVGLIFVFIVRPFKFTVIFLTVRC